METIFKNFVQLGNYIKENNIQEKPYFITCKTCNELFAAFDKNILTCSDECQNALDVLNDKINELSKMGYNTSRTITIGQEKAFIDLTTFSLKAMVQGATEFGYIITYKGETIKLSTKQPLLYEYKSITDLKATALRVTNV